MSALVFVSSGDLIADRRYRWAMDYLERGEAVAASDILTQALETAPAFAAAWFALAQIRERAGDLAGAVQAYSAARDSGPADLHGASLHLVRLGEGRASSRMEAEYARLVFDGNAAEFDDTLINRLGYRGPQLLLEAIRRISGGVPNFRSALDLGCGTGLSGAAFRPYCARLAGVDISAAMIVRAKDRAVYDRLHEGEMLEFLSSEPAGVHDLIVAADVLVYVGDLGPVLRDAARTLAPGGLVAFSVEAHSGPGAVLQPTLRYAHGVDAVEAAATGAGLHLLELVPVSTRSEKGVPVPGLVVIASNAPRSGGIGHP